MRELRLYLETSVWNFVYADDAPEKKDVTRKFFANLESSPFVAYVSEAVLLEFAGATEEKERMLLELISKHEPTVLRIDSEVEELAMEYLRQEALPAKARYDALHIACASVNELDLVVSWNLRHIANVRRQEKVQGVNLLNGFTKPLQLITPMEVSEHEESENGSLSC